MKSSSTWLIALILTASCGDRSTLDHEGDAEHLQASSNAPFDGYTLVAPLRDTTTYLVDMAGEVAHTWSSEYTPGNSVYLLDDGSILRCARVPAGPLLAAGGSGGRIQRIDWSGELRWDFLIASERILQHHDIEPMPNGNVLLIAWERKTRSETLAVGRDPELLMTSVFSPDFVLEVEPQPPNGGRIVWEWHAWDHLVQDLDPKLPNFGRNQDYPGRIDINGDRKRHRSTAAEDQQEQQRLQELGYLEVPVSAPTGAEDRNRVYPQTRGLEPPWRPLRLEESDWLHTNAIDFNPELNLIALSVREFNEVWILDHSTTSLEASGSKGGRFGRGGELLYRWGNPASYAAGSEADRQFYRQHDLHWIPANHPGGGHLLLFNNGSLRAGRPWSSVDEFRIPVEELGRYSRRGGNAFGPRDLVWRYEDKERERFFSAYISGAQRLPNGNTLICSGETGYVFEVTPTGETVWEWQNPIGGPQVDSVRSTAVPSVALFRATRIAPDHPGLHRLARAGR